MHFIKIWLLFEDVHRTKKIGFYIFYCQIKTIKFGYNFKYFYFLS